MNHLDSTIQDMRNWVIVETYENLPEVGVESIKYFVIKQDEDNPVYQEYLWVDTYTEYDEETETETEVLAHYILAYDYYHQE